MWLPVSTVSRRSNRRGSRATTPGGWLLPPLGKLTRAARPADQIFGVGLGGDSLAEGVGVWAGALGERANRKSESLHRAENVFRIRATSSSARPVYRPPSGSRIHPGEQSALLRPSQLLGLRSLDSQLRRGRLFCFTSKRY
jgi:hypothetical protein